MNTLVIQVFQLLSYIPYSPSALYFCSYYFLSSYVFLIFFLFSSSSFNPSWISLDQIKLLSLPCLCSTVGILLNTNLSPIMKLQHNFCIFLYYVYGFEKKCLNCDSLGIYLVYNLEDRSSFFPLLFIPLPFMQRFIVCPADLSWHLYLKSYIRV